MPGPEKNQPQESLQRQNKRAIEGLKQYGDNITKAILLVNETVEEIAREQGLTDKIYFKAGVDDERLVGGRFNYKTEQENIHSRAELEIFMPLQRTEEMTFLSQTDPNETTFTVDSYFTVYNNENVISSQSLKSWDLNELTDKEDPEKMEEFRTEIKNSFIEGIQKTRQAENLLNGTQEEPDK